MESYTLGKTGREIDQILEKAGGAATSSRDGYMTKEQVRALAGKAETSHTHAVLDVTGLSDALAGKAEANHTHQISGVTGLEAALGAKADIVPFGDIISTEITEREGTAPQTIKGNILLNPATGHLVMQNGTTSPVYYTGWNASADGSVPSSDDIKSDGWLFPAGGAFYAYNARSGKWVDVSKDPAWGNITGDIEDQEDLMGLLTFPVHAAPVTGTSSATATTVNGRTVYYCTQLTALVQGDLYENISNCDYCAVYTNNPFNPSSYGTPDEVFPIELPEGALGAMVTVYSNTPTAAFSIAKRTGTQTLAEKLEEKADTSALASYATTTALSNGLASKANSNHTHTIANITNLQSALDAKASTSAVASKLETSVFNSYRDGAKKLYSFTDGFSSLGFSRDCLPGSAPSAVASSGSDWAPLSWPSNTNGIDMVDKVIAFFPLDESASSSIGICEKPLQSGRAVRVLARDAGTGDGGRGYVSFHLTADIWNDFQNPGIVFQSEAGTGFCVLDADPARYAENLIDETMRKRDLQRGGCAWETHTSYGTTIEHEETICLARLREGFNGLFKVIAYAVTSNNLWVHEILLKVSHSYGISGMSLGRQVAVEKIEEKATHASQHSGDDLCFTQIGVKQTDGGLIVQVQNTDSAALQVNGYLISADGVGIERLSSPERGGEAFTSGDAYINCSPAQVAGFDDIGLEPAFDK